MSADAPVCPGDEILMQLAQDGVAEAERAAVDAHVQSCSRCTAVLTELRHLEELGRGLAGAALNQRDRERIGRWTDSVLQSLAERRKDDPPRPPP